MVRRIPVLLDRLAEGSLNVTTARLLAPHLTEANRDALLAAASGKSKREVEELVARYSPRPSRGTTRGSREIPAKVRRTVWLRDHGCCVFRSAGGRRCNERAFVEFHHLDPHGVGGEATVGNIELRCRAHNLYEAELFYGRRGPREAPTRSGTSSFTQGRDTTGRTEAAVPWASGSGHGKPDSASRRAHVGVDP